MSAHCNAVFDCNVYLQAMISSRGPAHECWDRAVSGEVTLYVTSTIIEEIRALSTHPKLRRFRALDPDRVERFIQELLSHSVLAEMPPAVFQYPRDPDDAHYVNLALATGSQLVVSNDKDLLALMDEDVPEGRLLRASYPQFRVLTPPQFLDALRASG